MTNFEEIKTKIKGEVDVSEETLVKYSRDASIFEIRPKAVVHPKDAEDVKALVKWAASQKETEPGVFYRDFEPLAQKRGLLLPCYTASKSINTLGGMAANNSAGEKTLAYGQTKDYVEELDVVLSDGNQYTFTDLEQRELEAKLKLSNFEGEIYRKVFHLIKENQKLIQAAKPKTSKNSAGYLLWEVYPHTEVFETSFSNSFTDGGKGH